MQRKARVEGPRGARGGGRGFYLKDADRGDGPAGAVRAAGAETGGAGCAASSLCLRRPQRGPGPAGPQAPHLGRGFARRGTASFRGCGREIDVALAPSGVLSSLSAPSLEPEGSEGSGQPSERGEGTQCVWVRLCAAVSSHGDLS